MEYERRFKRFLSAKLLNKWNENLAWREEESNRNMWSQIARQSLYVYRCCEIINIFSYRLVSIRHLNILREHSTQHSKYPVDVSLKADSHIACRAHAVSPAMPCR
jgi:hypothetical protein